MIKTISSNQSFRTRLHPEKTLTPEQIEQEQAKLRAFRERCQPIFEKVKPQLMKTNYNWYLAVEPDSGEYFIGETDLQAGSLCRQKYPSAIPFVFRINETGACGTI